MRTAVGLGVVVILAAAALYQLYPVKQDGAFDVLLPGEFLNLDAIDPASRRRISAGTKEGCFIAWVMDPDCAGCRRLAEQQGMQVRAKPNFYWLFAGSESAVEDFVRTYQLDLEQVLRMAPARDVRQALRRVGVGATPTRVVVRNRDLAVQQVRVLNPQLLEAPAALENHVCQAT